MNEPLRGTASLKKIALTVRAFSYTASSTAVLLGAALAAQAGHPMHWVLFALSLLGVLLFHTAANLLNDCFDHRRGLDRQILPASGGVVRGWYTEGQVFRAGMITLVLGAGIGLFLAYRCGWVILLVGAVGAAAAAAYTAPGFCLKYAGFGDAAVFLAFGALPVFGSYWVQARSFSWLPILWSIPLALPTVGILHANNWRDIESDRAKGCRTLAGLLGKKGSAAYYRCLILCPFALAALYLGVTGMPGLPDLAPLSVLLVALALPAAAGLVRTRRKHDREWMGALDARTAQFQMLYGVLLIVGFILGRFLS